MTQTAAKLASSTGSTSYHANTSFKNITKI